MNRLHAIVGCALGLSCAAAPSATPPPTETGIIVLEAPPPGTPRSGSPPAPTLAPDAKPGSCAEAMRSAGGEVLRGGTSSLLNRGTYLTACGVPGTTRVEICLATRDGQLRGLDVVTTPANEGLTACIADRVRSLSFPSTPSLDVSRVVFAEL